jgi:hypothetical protein
MVEKKSIIKNQSKIISNELNTKIYGMDFIVNQRVDTKYKSDF